MSAAFSLVDTTVAEAPSTLVAPIALPETLVRVSAADVTENP